MTEEEIELAMAQFISRFNQMCRSNRRDFLVRERQVVYEGVASTKTYKVSYQVNKKGGEWRVFASTKGFLGMFKEKFPLFKVSRKGEGMLGFEGLYAKDFKQFAAQELESKLKAYLENISKLPKNAFIRS